MSKINLSKFSSWLYDLVELNFEEEFGDDFKQLITYQEGGYLTRDKGFVLKLNDGTEFQITIVGEESDDYEELDEEDKEISKKEIDKKEIDDEEAHGTGSDKYPRFDGQ